MCGTGALEKLSAQPLFATSFTVSLPYNRVSEPENARICGGSAAGQGSAARNAVCAPAGRPNTRRHMRRSGGLSAAGQLLIFKPGGLGGKAGEH